MRDEKAFLRGIVDAPDDDALRLVYADWLEENGWPDRGQFIRLHVRWCRRPLDARPDEELRRQLLAAWEASGLPDASLPNNTPHVYDRGFVDGEYRVL